MATKAEAEATTERPARCKYCGEVLTRKGRGGAAKKYCNVKCGSAYERHEQTAAGRLHLRATPGVAEPRRSPSAKMVKRECVNCGREFKTFADCGFLCDDCYV